MFLVKPLLPSNRRSQRGMTTVLWTTVTPDKGKSGVNKCLYSQQMSKEINIRIIDEDCGINFRVTLAVECIYCGSPTVAYTWCRKCMLKFALIKKTLTKAHAPQE